jgi:hypothetical protein
MNALLEGQEQTEIVGVAPEEPAMYGVADEGSRRLQERKATSRSRYAALAIWLAAQDAEQVLLTFEQIERLIRSPLPESALQLRAWWSNDRVGHTHSILWLEAGWKVVYVDLGEGQVIFARIKPDEGD